MKKPSKSKMTYAKGSNKPLAKPMMDMPHKMKAGMMMKGKSKKGG